MRNERRHASEKNDIFNALNNRNHTLMRYLNQLLFLLFCFVLFPATIPARSGEAALIATRSLMKNSLPLLLILYVTAARAQSGSAKSIGLLAGAGWSRHPYAELGISKNSMAYGGHHAFGSAYYFSSEVHISNRPLLGPKAGAWLAVLPLLIGLSVVDYTDFGQQCLVLKPEFGVGFDRVKLSFTWNRKLTNHSFEGLADHSFSLVYCFRLKTLRQRAGN